jgi:hypothetical protein
MRGFAMIAAICGMLLIAGCDEPTLAIRGDSTAIASRSGLAKAWNLHPAWDAKRWWVIVAHEFSPPRTTFNDGVGGQDIRTMRDKMLADHDHRTVTTIIYDRRNNGEEPTQYVTDLKRAVATLTTDHFLIMPQVPQSRGNPETSDQIASMAEIDRQVLAAWPQNTFSPLDREAFLAALDPDDTRIDGLHRNEKGQLIEAAWIGRWLRSRNW